MASYPIEATDTSGVIDAVNNLLSGPSGLGQDFGGFSSFATGYITGNFRLPYSSTVPASLYVAPINLATAAQLSGDTFEYTFASAQVPAPFVPGQGVTISGVADPYYNDTFTRIGVVSCNTTSVILRSAGEFFPIQPPSTGGTASLSSMGEDESTDCNVKVVITGGTDRVFISSQINAIISYTATVSSDLTVSVFIDRYKGFPNSDPVNPGFLFNFDETVAFRQYEYPGLTGTGSLASLESIFSTFPDTDISPGYYWYILSFKFDQTGGDLEVTQCETGLRSMTTQVVKQ